MSDLPPTRTNQVDFLKLILLSFFVCQSSKSNSKVDIKELQICPIWCQSRTIICYISDTPVTTHRLRNMDAKFDIQIMSDWPQMGQIRDFLRPVFRTFLLGESKCTETYLEKAHSCPIK